MQQIASSMIPAAAATGAARPTAAAAVAARPLAALAGGGCIGMPRLARRSGILHSSSLPLCRPARRPLLQPAAAVSAAVAAAAAAAAATTLGFLSGSSGCGLAAEHAASAAASLALGEVGEGLEAPVQLAYLVTLMGFLVVGAFVVVRQVLIRRELEEAAKVMGERVRSNDASGEDYFELGVILLRKKLYTQATKNLERALKQWEGAPEERAQVHNALGYALFNMEKVEAATAQYELAVALQPGYVTAWNNLGDAHERQKRYAEALAAYREALTYAPDNTVARARADFCRTRLDRTA